MSVVREGDTISLVGACGVEEAERLVSLLQDHPDAVVDLSASGQVHTALWQALLALAPAISGEPGAAFARQWLAPLLSSRRSGAAT
ncbi:MAG: hypothetical protein Q7T73_05615 [Beijerinckiaceae bacterium]|nr:hypothetical protein [Beijerinckiaceae bacterium]